MYWDGGSKAFPESSFTTPVEFQIDIDLLRNEKPLWWDEPPNSLFILAKGTHGFKGFSIATYNMTFSIYFILVTPSNIRHIPISGIGSLSNIFKS